MEMKEGYSKKLTDVRQRLDLLGYSITNINKMYNDLIEEMQLHECEVIDFKRYFNAISSIDVCKVNLLADGYEYGFGDYASKCLLVDPEIKSKLEITNEWDVAYFLENIDPYITLRILAENPTNLNFELQWRFADVVEGGWARREEIVCKLEPAQKILVVTEGSTDSFVIKKALLAIYPSIADIFDFVDMENNYPFTGVGNLYNFCQGLAKIKILNRVLIVFDNDAIGVEKYELAKQLDKPNNLHVWRLPDHEMFSSFDTIGPEGESKSDIIGKAVSIESFLDYGSISPIIRWTSYNKKNSRYQGEIENKEELIRIFKSYYIGSENYNTTMLKYLIDCLLEEVQKLTL